MRASRRNARRGLAVVATAGLVAGLSGLVAGPAPAATGGHHNSGPPVRTLVRGLSDPWGMQSTGHHRFVVAENATGSVTEVGRHGHRRTLISGAVGVAGVAASRRHVFAVLGGGNETGSGPVGKYPASSVLRADRDGSHVKVIANLLDYELAHNPDGQKQFDSKHKPYDALSNPFSMNLSRFGLLVAEGGANDVLRVNPRTGRVSTFFVPPTVKDVAACLKPGAQGNPGTVGCDPVATGIAVSRGAVYVSTLGAEVPGAGRVYKLDGWTHRVLHVWKGLTAPTGVAVGRHGEVYVSEATYGAPQSAPPPNFDPSTVGRITRISCDGHMTHAAVTMPIGMTFQHGHLYSTAWALAAQFGVAKPGQKLGQLVQVSQGAFH